MIPLSRVVLSPGRSRRLWLGLCPATWIWGVALLSTQGCAAANSSFDVSTSSTATGATSPANPLDRPWEDEIVYVLDTKEFLNGDPSNDAMLRRFGADIDRYNDGYRGGDLAGVIQKLDDLADLGVTALLLLPVVQNDRHPFGPWLAGGYRPSDYLSVDENLGTTETLIRLIDKAHARGMRVILDMPLALPGLEHPLYTPENIAKGYFGDTTPYGVRCWNAANPFVADYLIRVSICWRDLTRCDGFRLDSAQLMPFDFWARYARVVGGRPWSESLILMAEVAEHPRKIGAFVGGTGFTTAYDFSSLVIQEVFGKGADVGKIAFVVGEAEHYYPNPGRMCGEIDNYDDAFVKRTLEPKRERAKLALGFLLTTNRVPLLYSGNEQGVWYGRVGGLFEPANRDPEFLAHTKRLIELRRREPALRRGSFSQVWCRNPVYAFEREFEGDRLLVATNNSTDTARVQFPIGETDWTEFEMVDLMTGEVAKRKGIADPIFLPGLGIAILRLR